MWVCTQQAAHKCAPCHLLCMLSRASLMAQPGSDGEHNLHQQGIMKHVMLASTIMKHVMLQGIMKHVMLARHMHHMKHVMLASSLSGRVRE
jgi:hypothetical protein